MAKPSEPSEPSAGLIWIEGNKVEKKDSHILTTLPSGAVTANWPPGDAAFAQTALQAGFGLSHQAQMDYLFEHELLHVLVPLKWLGFPSHVHSKAAYGLALNEFAAQAEEKLIWLVQTLWDCKEAEEVREIRESLAVAGYVRPCSFAPLAKEPYVTHRCLGQKQNDGFNDGPFQVPCDAVRLSDATGTRLCGEPCSFVMGKGGSASPEWPKTKDNTRFNPWQKG